MKILLCFPIYFGNHDKALYNIFSGDDDLKSYHYKTRLLPENKKSANMTLSASRNILKL